MLLVTRNDFEVNNRQITQSNYNNGTLNQHISDAQFVDVQKVMGLDFYNDMIRNTTAANYQTLLNGSTYVYGGKTYTNVGLKAVIVFYAYARYILSGSQVDTPFGYVEKQNQTSQSVPYQQKKSMYNMNRDIAFNYWENVLLFIDRNKTDYPLWENDCSFNTQTFRISKIG